MFNATAQSGVLFGNNQNQNLFGANQTQSSGFFGSSNSNLINGTTVKYVPLSGTDTIQKNNTTVNVATKLNCISAMKEYEAKSLEELRFEDYTANRINAPKSNTTGMFGGNQATPTLFNNQNSLFQNSSPFGLPQQNVLGTTTQTPLFGSTNQTNAFGSKTLFGSTSTSTNSAFGSFNSQSKTGPLFGAGTQNKQLFGSPQSTQSSSLFGGTQQTSTPSLFGNQQQTQQTGFFGGLQSQQQASQSTGLFNANTSTSSFGFQPPSSTGIFGGNNAAKPFGTSNTNFSFSNSNAQTNPTLFGGNTQTGGLFTQNNANQGFGSAAKPSLFPSNNTFSTPASSQSPSIFPQTNTGFGQTNMFGSQPKSNASPFGTTNAFNNAQKPNLFGPTSNTGFGTQNNSLFGNMGSTNQPFGSTITTSTIAPANALPQIGITTPAEAVFQQQVAQQKILSLVSNRPYGINKLFLGQNMTSTDCKILVADNTANNANILSLAIKRNETDNLATPQRRRILNQKTKINPNQMSHAFSGFDEDEDYSVKSNKFDNFMIKREDWKFLPPNAFEKSRRSLVNNSSINCNLSSGKYNSEILSPMASISQFIRETNKNYCSTPLSDDSFAQPETMCTPPNYNDRASPVNLDKRRDPINSNNEKERLMKSKELKEESLTVSSGSIKKLNDTFNQNNQVNSKENYNDEDDDDDDDESINGDVCGSCQVTLTKRGYYTAPTMDILNRLACDNECWVENFIIGRKGFGSIRFPGFTNVFGLNMDEIVDISSKEVAVYPDEELKPEVGEGLNNPAQIILHEIFPNDKSSGAIIKDCERLKKMNFEERLRKLSAKNGSKFISYIPEDGTWIFEVEHFSRYGYIESDDDDEEVAATDQSTQKEADSSKVNLKKETLMKLPGKENISNSNVISAEADSLSNIEDNQELFKHKSALDKLSVNCASRNLYKLKQSFYKYDSDEEVGSSGLFNNDFRKHSNILIDKSEHGEIEKYQPLPKKFESSEMGERIFNNQMDCFNINSDLYENQLIGMSEENNRRPIKPLTAEQIASTVKVESCNKSLQRIYIPNHLRDLRMSRMPFLFDKFMNYIENVSVDVYKNYSNDASLIQGNRYRVGLHVSCNEKSHGIKFMKINNINKNNDSMSSFRNFHKRNGPNTIMILKCNYELSNHQEKLINTAYSVSKCLTDVDSKCPLWSPIEGLDVLKSYLNIHNKFQSNSSQERIFGRIIELCSALWNNVGNEEAYLPKPIQDVCRKQLLSKWIRMECKDKLMKEVETVMNPLIIDIEKCNTLILNALCSGEIQLACQLAISTKQHRLSLLIAQCASDSQSREVLKEQLNQWLKSRTDLHISRNLLCIYVVLSGQTSFVLSDGSSLAPFKHMNWVQAFGSHLWHIQSYLSSIKSAIDSYDEVFKTELDIPSPFPVDIEHDSSNEDVKYYDCCYHLIKLYCDRLYDLDVLLNPPTISRDCSHKLSWDWSASWHLANILTSLGFSKNISPKISMEYAAQLERGGLWQMAAFVILHIPELRTRSHLLKSLVHRQINNSKNLSENEKFLVDKLNVPIEWIHEGKAIYCKTTGNIELEAYHWLKCGQYERSYQLYINQIIPNLLINDKFEKIKEILSQFVNNKSDRVLANWSVDGEIYLKYIYIDTSLRTLKLTNKLANHSYLIDCENEGGFEELVFHENEELNIQIQKLKIEINKLSKATEGFRVTNEAQRICKQQFVLLSNRFLLMCE